MYSIPTSIFILYVISKFQKIHGKKALQKILYFISETNNLYQFQWNKYGPYSEEIKYDLDYGIQEGFIKVTPILLSNGATQLNLLLTESGNKMVEFDKLNSNLSKSLDNIYELLNEKKPREMELLASIHYIVKDRNDMNIDKIHTIISKLKPESGFSKEEISTTLVDLKTNFNKYF